MRALDKNKENYVVGGFLFYRSYYEAIETLSNKNKLLAYEAITGYALNGKEPTDLPLRVLAILKIAIPNLDANRRKYLKKLEKEILANPNVTTPIFENEVILPRKEKKVVKNNDDNDDREFTGCDGDDVDEFEP